MCTTCMQMSDASAGASPVVKESQKKLMIGMGIALVAGVGGIYVWQRSKRRGKSRRKKSNK